MRLAKSLLIIILALALIVSGCWDRVELEDVAWVQAIGFDKGPEDFLTTTLEIGIPRTLRGGGPMTAAGAGGPSYATTTIVARDFSGALDLAALNLGRRMSLLHTQLYLFGEELARSDIRSVVTSLDRHREARGSILVAVAHGRAEDILRVNNSPLEVSPSRFIQTVIQQHTQTGLFYSVALARDVTNLLESSSSSPRCPILALASDYVPPEKEAGKGGAPGGGGANPFSQYPSTPNVGERPPVKVDLEEMPPSQSTTDLEGWQVPEVGGGPVIMMGTAFFSDGKMAGTLTGDETRGMLLAANGFERAFFSVPDPTAPDNPELSLGVEATRSKTKVKVKRAESLVHIQLETHVDVSYLGIKTQTDYTDPRMTPLAEAAIEDHLKSVMDRAIAKTQAAGSDVCGFGEKVKRTFWTWPEFEAFAWLTKYPEAEIETTVDVRIHRYGLALRPLVIPPSEIIEPPK